MLVRTSRGTISLRGKMSSITPSVTSKNFLQTHNFKNAFSARSVHLRYQFKHCLSGTSSTKLSFVSHPSFPRAFSEPGKKYYTPPGPLFAHMMSSNGSSAANANSHEKKAFARLPKNVRPENYKVFLKPSLKDLIFRGKMTVNLTAIQATDTIVCNAADLEVNNVQVNGANVKETIFSEDEETITVRLEHTLAEQSTNILTCDFNGVLNDQMKGTKHNLSEQGILYNLILSPAI